MGLPGTAADRLAAQLRASARRLVIPVARAAYTGIGHTPLAFVLDFPVMRRLKSQITHMPDHAVIALLGVLSSAGIRYWVAGGWGIDALLGRQTRRHYDLDIVISDSAEDTEWVGRVLSHAGFRPGAREFNPGLLMPFRHAWHDANGYTVEVMPVALHKPPFSEAGDAGEAGDAAGPLFTHGTIGGQRIPCVSARLQFILHEGYDTRLVDLADLDALRTHVDQAGGTPPR